VIWDNRAGFVDLINRSGPFLNYAGPKDTVLSKSPKMNPFTTHPQQQGITYLEHLSFAMGTAYRLFHAAVAFAVHALFPFISIEPEFDLEATAAFIKERNEWIETAKERGMEHSSLGFSNNDIGAPL
jgi:hypothetical protein